MKKISFTVIVLSAALIFAMAASANVPAPPANQQIGMPDTIFNNLEEADCRICHENPDQFPVKDVSIPDRHHLLVGTPIGDPDSAPFADAPGNFGCLSCHDADCSTGICSINVYRDCTFCHQQVTGDASVHHLTARAQGGACAYCHGDLVNTMEGHCTVNGGACVNDSDCPDFASEETCGDGHTIPSSLPSLVTPRPSGGEGLPLNSEGKGAGACNYCHSTGTGTMAPGTDTDTGILVYRNSTTHHNSVLDGDITKCAWCHDVLLPQEYYIRVCEGCHGFDSLHNIQLDSNGDGVINPGAELPYYGHIGNNDDCWGCHGFSTASSPGAGPITPHISSSDVSVVTGASARVVTLTGSAFTKTGDFPWEPKVVLTAPGRTSIEITPDSISQDLVTATIPAGLSSGNYALRVVKGDTKSNPVVISVVPDVVITNADCDNKRGILTVTGSGFSEKMEGTDAYISVTLNGVPLDIIYWADNKIRAMVSRCYGNSGITVNSLFGTASIGNGKPTGPCKGKGCNK
jgi:hypothetical protein